MIFRFKQFQFDCQQLILTRDDDMVPLNEKPAQLLAYFLQNKDKILSKTEILEHVWSDRVVTDQVVFQNISYLRALFGNDAIKTFSKKGYQWQLEFTKSEIIPAPKAPSELAQSNIIAGQQKAYRRWQNTGIGVAIVLIISLLVIYFTPNFTPNDNVSSIDPVIVTNASGQQASNALFLIPFAGRFHHQLVDEISQHNQILLSGMEHTFSAPKAADVTIDANAFFNSPFIIRNHLISHENQLVMTGFVFPRTYDNIDNGEQKYLLEYLIQGQYRSWQGYLLASSIPQLTQQLLAQARILRSSQFFSLQADAFATSELSLLHSENPENMDVLKHLIMRLINEDNYDVASARIEQLLQLSQQRQHPVYEAMSTWFKGQVMLKLNQLPLALEQLTLANKMMLDANMLALQSEVNKSLAEIAVVKRDFKQVQEYLFKAASQARLANRPVQEIRAYTLLSIYASKLGFKEARYEHLFHAKTLLADYALDGSHYMLPYYHFALFEPETEGKIKWYQEVLKQPVTPENYWVFFSASAQLTDIYIEQQNWTDALTLAQNVDETGRSASLSATIYRAMAQPEQAREFAKSAFNSARAQRLDWLGLDMALLLLELNSDENNAADEMLYLRYIRGAAPYWWLQRNEARLAQVGITSDPDTGYNNQR